MILHLQSNDYMPNEGNVMFHQQQQQKQRILLFSGGLLDSWALKEIRPGDTLVGADRGALFLVQHGYAPDLAVGDFDSVTSEELERIRRASKAFETCDPIMKDLTDTEMAFQWALRRNPAEIVMLGVLGSRWDHSLANVHLLRQAAEAGAAARIVDAHNRMTPMIGPAVLALERSRFTHVSLLPLSLEVRGITLSGFQYPLHRASLTLGQSLGISNVLTGDTGTVEIEQGHLLVIESTD